MVARGAASGSACNDAMRCRDALPQCAATAQELQKMQNAGSVGIDRRKCVQPTRRRLRASGNLQ